MNFNEIIEEVYKQQIESLIYTFFCAVIDETPEKEEHFLRGFKEITEAKEKLKKLLAV